MSVEHYENFPVASLLLPARLRPPVKIIYRFARNADDFADEGDAPPADRLAALTAYEQALDCMENNCPAPADERLFQALGEVVRRHGLPMQALRDLLSAFKQDVITTRYANFADLLDYCRRSANPVGCLMLHLYDADTPHNLRDSDAICTALQLINFWQDVAIDWRKQRIYLPLEDLARFGVTEAQLADAQIDDGWRALMRFEVARARTMILGGAPLALRLPGRIGWELRLVVQGGLRILERIEGADYDVFNKRPTLRKFEWFILVWRAILMARRN